MLRAGMAAGRGKWTGVGVVRRGNQVMRGAAQSARFLQFSVLLSERLTLHALHQLRLCVSDMHAG